MPRANLQLPSKPRQVRVVGNSLKTRISSRPLPASDTSSLTTFHRFAQTRQNLSVNQYFGAMPLLPLETAGVD